MICFLLYCVLGDPTIRNIKAMFTPEAMFPDYCCFRIYLLLGYWDLQVFSHVSKNPKSFTVL